jgi:hypothetical protein
MLGDKLEEEEDVVAEVVVVVEDNRMERCASTSRWVVSHLAMWRMATDEANVVSSSCNDSRRSCFFRCMFHLFSLFIRPGNCIVIMDHLMRSQKMYPKPKHCIMLCADSSSIASTAALFVVYSVVP